MLNEQETAAMCAVVSDLETLAKSRLPGYLHATYQLQRLASTTGDEWESIVRTLLASHPTLETSPALEYDKGAEGMGYMAREGGKAVADCPWREETHLGRSWVHGWFLADDKLTAQNR